MPKTISDKYAEALDTIKALETEKAELATASEKIHALEQQITDLTAKVTELTESAEQMKTDHAAAITEKNEKIQALEASEQKLKGQLALSPGHIQAGGTDPVKEQAGGDGGDDLQAQYDAIKDPAARTAFYREHKKQLIKQ